MDRIQRLTSPFIERLRERVEHVRRLLEEDRDRAGFLQAVGGLLEGIATYWPEADEGRTRTDLGRLLNDVAGPAGLPSLVSLGDLVLDVSRRLGSRPFLLSGGEGMQPSPRFLHEARCFVPDEMLDDAPELAGAVLAALRVLDVMGRLILEGDPGEASDLPAGLVDRDAFLDRLEGRIPSTSGERFLESGSWDPGLLGSRSDVLPVFVEAVFQSLRFGSFDPSVSQGDPWSGGMFRDFDERSGLRRGSVGSDDDDFEHVAQGVILELIETATIRGRLRTTWRKALVEDATRPIPWLRDRRFPTEPGLFTCEVPPDQTPRGRDGHRVIGFGGPWLVRLAEDAVRLLPELLDERGIPLPLHRRICDPIHDADLLEPAPRET